MNNNKMGWITEWIVYDGLNTDEEIRGWNSRRQKNSNLKDTDIDVYKSFEGSKYDGVRDQIIYLFDKIGQYLQLTITDCLRSLPID